MVVKNFKQKEADNSNNTGFVCDRIKGSRTILLDDLDELNEITEDLKVLIYLETLVQEDFSGGYITEVFDSQTKDAVELFLLELQTDKVKKLDCLMKKVCL